MDMQGMGLYGVVGILSIILGIVKELLIIFILFRGIQITNVYLKKNKGGVVEEIVEDKIKENTEEKEDEIK